MAWFNQLAGHPSQTSFWLGFLIPRRVGHGTPCCRLVRCIAVITLMYYWRIWFHETPIPPPRPRAQNAGAALVPLAVSASVAHYGWRAALYVPAASTVSIACALALLLHGSPAAARHAADRRSGHQHVTDLIGKQPKLPRGLARMLTQQVGYVRAIACRDAHWRVS